MICNDAVHRGFRMRKSVKTKTGEDKVSQSDTTFNFFDANLPPGELQRILARIEENLAFRQILKDQAPRADKGAYALPQLPPISEVDRRVQFLRLLRAPLFGPVSGPLLSFVCYVLNLPIRLLGRKQMMFNEELLLLFHDVVPLLHVLSEQSLVLASWSKDLEQIQSRLQEIEETQRQIQDDLRELEEALNRANS
jgi:hypothetical protein